MQVKYSETVNTTIRLGNIKKKGEKKLIISHAHNNGIQ